MHAFSHFLICLVILLPHSFSVKPSHYRRITHKTASLAIPNVISFANQCNPIKHHVAPTLKYLLQNTLQLKKVRLPPSFLVFHRVTRPFNLIWVGDHKVEKSGHRRASPAPTLDFSRPIQEMVARKGNGSDFPQVLEDFSQISQVCSTFAINRILNPDVFFLSQRLYYGWNMLQCIIHEGTHKNACLF